mgnify:CR=1 FL=1
MSTMPPLSISEKDFALIRDIVYEHSGIKLKDSKRALVTNRLRKRLIALDMKDFGQYCALLRTRDGLRRELEEVIDSLTTNETYFFRESKHFDVLMKTVFPAAKAKPGKSVSIWCAGCSTGQEPYTAAICALEFMAAEKCRLPVSIFASDISPTALAEAKAGAYPERKTKGLAPHHLRTYFDKTPEGFSVKKELRNIVRFQQLNLLTEKPNQRFDVIFCRNVMIYFDADSQAKVVANIRDCLAREGMFFIGHAESLYRNSQGFEVERIDNAIVYRKTEEKPFSSKPVLPASPINTMEKR